MIGPGKRLAQCERGAAMVETALLCFFVYAPILMMVLILGDVSLERAQGEIASAYLAWTPESISSDRLREDFFKDSDSELGTGTVYYVSKVEDDTTDAPGFFAAAPTGDNQDRNVWAKLQLLAVGEWWSSMEWKMVNGQWDLVPVVHRTMDSDARYLILNKIVPDTNLPTTYMGLSEGQDLPFSWGGPTTRALAATALMNHQFPGSTQSALRESKSALELWHTSVFFDELDRFSFGEKDYSFDLPRENNTAGIRLKYGSTDKSEPSSALLSGKTWLFNPEAKPTGNLVRDRLYGLSPQLFSYRLPTGVYITMDGMPDTQAPTVFDQPGDPRPNGSN